MHATVSHVYLLAAALIIAMRGAECIARGNFMCFQRVHNPEVFAQLKQLSDDEKLEKMKQSSRGLLGWLQYDPYASERRTAQLEKLEPSERAMVETLEAAFPDKDVLGVFLKSNKDLEATQLHLTFGD